MSVDQPRVIDIVSKNEKGDIFLSISDHLDWQDVYAHLLTLQTKINTYIAFVESGEVYEHYPEVRGRAIFVEVLFHHAPLEEAVTFLSRAARIVESAGAGFRYRVLPQGGENPEHC